MNMSKLVDENFYFRVARVFFYRWVLTHRSTFGMLTDNTLIDVDGIPWPNGKMILLMPDGTKMQMTKERGIQFLCEVAAWNAWYLPDCSLQGATVIDGGSGCGESDYYFRKHGAVKVIGVEIREDCVRDHRANASLNHWQGSEVINAPFDPEQLKRPHTFVKLDVEGGEKLLLQDWVTPDLLGSARIELHPQIIGKEACDALIKKFDLVPVGTKSRILAKEAVPGMMWKTQRQSCTIQDVNAAAVAWCEHD